MSFFSRSTKSASSSMASGAKGDEAPTPTHQIFTSPPEGVVPKKKWEYSASQMTMIEELRAYTSTLLLPPSDPYHAWESRFLSDPGCHPRYMRAAKWKMPDAKTRIKGTIEWRREYKPELIDPAVAGKEAETGKIILTGFDLEARPILYMRPGRENTETGPRQIQHLIYHLERAIDLMPPGQEQVAIVVDYKSATSQSNPSISTARKVLGILQNHYVERLGRGLVVNMSWWINAFFSGISPFLDPITRDKIRFNPNLAEMVPTEQLDAEFGGQYRLEYDYPTYWKTITEFCHIAPDGSRSNDKGEKWVPPLGNGIKAAAMGYAPKEGAIQTGEMEKVDGQPNGITTATRSVPKGSDELRATSDAGTKGQTPAQLIANEQRAEVGDETNDGVKVEVNGSGGDHIGLATGVGGLSIAHASQPPTRATKPGAPEGEVVFDHEPSAAEIKEVRESMDQRR